MLSANHFPEPGFARVVRRNGRRVWQARSVCGHRLPSRAVRRGVGHAMGDDTYRFCEFESGQVGAETVVHATARGQHRRRIVSGEVEGESGSTCAAGSRLAEAALASATVPAQRFAGRVLQERFSERLRRAIIEALSLLERPTD